MSDHERFSRLLTRSVTHIFKNFLEDSIIEEVYESQSGNSKHQVAVEFTGTLKGEIVINLPKDTLNEITKKFIQSNDARSIKTSYSDVAGELANLITGTFANQLQYAEHDLRLQAPEFNEDPIEIKTLYENINLSFNSSYGGFDVDIYFKEI